MRILIAVPTFESIYPDTYKSIYELDPADNELDFAFVRGYDCATARNRIAQKAIDGNYDYVLMVDNDVVLPKDVLIHLLEKPKDVCLGYYLHRSASGHGTERTSVCKLGFFNYPAESQYLASELKEMRKKGIAKFEIHGGGMGCALIKVDVFRRLQYPWYDWVNYRGNKRGMLSEDLFFCEQCHGKKIPVYSDTRAGCGHMIRYIRWPEEETND